MRTGSSDTPISGDVAGVEENVEVNEDADDGGESESIAIPLKRSASVSTGSSVPLDRARGNVLKRGAVSAAGELVSRPNGMIFIKMRERLFFDDSLDALDRIDASL